MKCTLLVVFFQLSFIINSYAKSSYGANEDTTILINLEHQTGC
jgi:hypothetical protein